MPYDFTERKFKGLTSIQQHKICAETLEKMCKDPTDSGKKIYKQLLGWLNVGQPNFDNYKELSDLYHWHLKEAKRSKKEHNLLPFVRQGDRCVAQPQWDIHIYLDHIRSAHNVGSIIRTTEAFSLGTLYFSEQTPPIEHKQVKDAAMGADQWVQARKDIDLEHLPKPMIAVETCENAVSLFDFEFPESFTMILGNEEYGCSDRSLKMADYIIEIPLRGRKNSLNVANAFAIVASEIYRQKHSKKND